MTFLILYMDIRSSVNTNQELTPKISKEFSWMFTHKIVECEQNFVVAVIFYYFGNGRYLHACTLLQAYEHGFPNDSKRVFHSIQDT